MNTTSISRATGETRNAQDLSYERIDALMQRARVMRAEAVAGLIASLVRPFARRGTSGGKTGGASAQPCRAA